MKEKLLFEMYKDTNLIGAQYFKKEMRKYKLEDPNALYIKIINYQVKKYGGTLAINCEKGNRETAIKNQAKAVKRKWDRKRVRDISEQIYKRNNKRKEDE